MQPTFPAILAYLVARLGEPSTWRGIVTLLTAFGVALSPDQVGAIVAAGLAVHGLIGAFAPDKIAGPPKNGGKLALMVGAFLFAAAPVQAQLLPWRQQSMQTHRDHESRLKALEGGQRQGPQQQPLIIQHPAPQIVLVPTPPPYQQISPQQQLPIVGQPQQVLPIQGAPQQQLPIAGQPQQQLPSPGQPQQQLPITAPQPKVMPPADPSPSLPPRADPAPNPTPGPVQSPSAPGGQPVGPQPHGQPQQNLPVGPVPYVRYALWRP